MRQKALENLRAAELLLAAGTCPNAATSRAYYAVYHAGWHLLGAQGEDPPDHGGRPYWRHDRFPENLLRATVMNEEDSETVEHLYGARVTADYYDDDITSEQAADFVRQAGELLQRLRIADG